MIALLFTLISFSSLAQTPQCATPMDCYQVQEAKRAEAVRIKKEQDEAAYRQQQLDLQAAQLQEMRAQREVMERELEIQKLEREETLQAEEEKNEEVTQ